jgi:hypothetical protein
MECSQPTVNSHMLISPASTLDRCALSSSPLLQRTLTCHCPHRIGPTPACSTWGRQPARSRTWKGALRRISWQCLVVSAATFPTRMNGTSTGTTSRREQQCQAADSCSRPPPPPPTRLAQADAPHPSLSSPCFPLVFFLAAASSAAPSQMAGEYESPAAHRFAAGPRRAEKCPVGSESAASSLECLLGPCEASGKLEFHCKQVFGHSALPRREKGGGCTGQASESQVRGPTAPAQAPLPVCGCRARCGGAVRCRRPAQGA